jgi:hypothetical protein
VSNSSSSSFIIKKDKLTKEQISAIWNHIKYSREHNIPTYSTEYKDEWNIVETDEIIGGETTMANFNMDGFLKAIGVDDVEMDGEKDYEIMHKIWDIRDEQEQKILEDVKVRPIEREVELPFILRRSPIMTYLYCPCPECGDQLRVYPKDVPKDAEHELIEVPVGFVIQCRECNRFFRLIDRTDVWKWGLVEKGDERFTKDKMHLFTKELEKRVFGNED